MRFLARFLALGWILCVTILIGAIFLATGIIALITFLGHGAGK